MRYGLKEDIIRDIKSVFSEFPELETAILYDSSVKGNFKNGSDVDISLVGEGLNLSVLNNISFKLDDLYLPYSFDLSIRKHITNLELLDHIERMGVPLYLKGA